jgi:hypothetical protein
MMHTYTNDHTQQMQLRPCKVTALLMCQLYSSRPVYTRLMGGGVRYC